MPSTRCASAPTPPDAITGTSTASTTARVSSRSKPVRAPSRSMLVSRISPAPSADDLARPFDGVDARSACARRGVDLPRVAAPTAWRRSRRRCTARRSAPAASSTSSGFLHARGVDADLVGAGVEQRADVVDRAHAAADRERNEHLVGDRLDHVVEQAARLDAGADVEERELVGALLVVAARDLDRIAGVAQVDEVDALDDAARRRCRGRG